MESTKKIMQYQLVMRILLLVILAAAYLVAGSWADYHHGRAGNNDSYNNMVIARKLMKLEPQPNCAGLGEYCDLNPFNFCCGGLYCDRNPGFWDWSGTCKQGSCQGVGQMCNVFMPCCWGLECYYTVCKKPDITASQEAAFMMDSA